MARVFQQTASPHLVVFAGAANIAKLPELVHRQQF